VILDGVCVPLLAAALFTVFITLWFMLPHMWARQRAVRGRK
jgi:hypothetical protein